MFGRWRGTVMAAALAGTLAATPAQAALEPREAALSPQSRVHEFKGTLDTGGQVNPIDVAQSNAGGTYGVCVEPYCQEGSIDVRGASTGKLHVAVQGGKGTSNVTLEVVRPDGSTAFAASTGIDVAKQRHLTLDAPADGKYTVRVEGEGTTATAGHMEFSGGSWLELPGFPTATGSALLDGFACPAGRRYDYPALPAGPAGGAVDDPLYEQQWGLEQIGVPAAWKRGFTGRGVTVAVIDTGIDTDHPEFGRRILPGLDSTVTESPDCAPGAEDDNGHGTGVASVLAAGADDGIGMAGIAPQAKILPIKVTVGDSYTNEDLFEGLRYAIDQRVDVINLSLGGDEKALLAGEDPAAVAPLIEEAWAKGIVVVAAAGNGHEPLCLWPARAPHALCVAGTDRDGLPSDFSALPNGEQPGNGVRAPAGSGARINVNGCSEYVVVAWWPGSSGACDFGSPAYSGKVGTSFGAPHVSGVAVLLKQAGLSNVEIVERIRMTASNRGGTDPVMGYGTIDADAATAGLTPQPAGPPRHAGRPPRTAPARPSASCVRARRALVRATWLAVRERTSLRRSTKPRTRAAAKRRLVRKLAMRNRAARRVARACR